MSDVLTNPSGFNLFKVLERHAERDYTLEEIREQLPEFVGNLQRQEQATRRG